jgi:ribose transport system permease protein
VHLAAYAIAGLLAALAGILLAGRTGAVDLQLGANFVLPSVAAAVIGGTSIFGGTGTYSGTIFGALILGVLATMMTFLDAGQAVQQIVYGSIVLGLAWVYARVTSSS